MTWDLQLPMASEVAAHPAAGAARWGSPPCPKGSGTARTRPCPQAWLSRRQKGSCPSAAVGSVVWRDGVNDRPRGPVHAGMYTKGDRRLLPYLELVVRGALRGLACEEGVVHLCVVECIRTWVCPYTYMSARRSAWASEAERSKVERSRAKRVPATRSRWSGGSGP